MTSQQPFFSLITATYNSIEFIEALQDSLLEQTFKDFEWVVQDGGSNDGTVDFFATPGELDLVFESRRDRGIYDAFNVATPKARGKYVLFLGSDDVLAGKAVLQSLYEAILRDGEYPALVLGSVKTGDEPPFNSRLGRITRVINSVHHQGALYERSLFDDFQYDLTVPVIADYELNVLLEARGTRALNTDVLVALCGAEGISRTSDEVPLYRGMHILRSRHIGRVRSFGYLVVGLGNVARRRILGGRRNDD